MIQQKQVWSERLHKHCIQAVAEIEKECQLKQPRGHGTIQPTAHCVMNGYC